MELKTYRSPGNHSFTAEPVSIKEVITASDVDNISAGQVVTDQQGTAYTILEIRHVLGRLWKVVLLAR